MPQNTRTDEVENLCAFLFPYGYNVRSNDTWEEKSAASPDVPAAGGKVNVLAALEEKAAARQHKDHPHMELRVLGHVEQHGHTLYVMKCSISSWPGGRYSFCCWSIQRRLRDFRTAMHDPIKDQLASVYSEKFGGTPFAHKGGPAGTTTRLSSWVSALANYINARACPPSILARLLKFTCAPLPRPGLVLLDAKAAGAAAAARMGKGLREVEAVATSPLPEAAAAPLAAPLVEATEASADGEAVEEVAVAAHSALETEAAVADDTQVDGVEAPAHAGIEPIGAWEEVDVSI